MAEMRETEPDAPSRGCELKLTKVAHFLLMQLRRPLTGVRIETYHMDYTKIKLRRTPHHGGAN